MSAGDAIRVERRGNVAIITLNRPQALNAMSYGDWVHLTATIRQLDREDHKITLITGEGRFFSSGANVKDRYTNRTNDAGDPERARYLQQLGSANMDLARALYEHPKLLIAALNGPAVGLAAAMLGHFDFIFAAESAYLTTPFSSLGIVAEAASSFTFVQRMGIGKAKEALVQGRKLPAAELLACGFVNQVFPDESQPAFTKTILAHIEDKFGDLDLDAAIRSRDLIRATYAHELDSANVREIMAGVASFETGVPQQRFADIANKKRRHKM